MESLNMNTLASSLPNSANAEKQLMDNFKAAALSITTLYRSSLDTSKQAYSSGYATCLLDVLHFVEAGVSVSGDDGEEMTIGKVMDWIEARLEAIKSTPEEEEEERDRLKEGMSMSKTSEDDAILKEDREREKRDRKAGGGGGGVHGSSKSPRRSKENLQEVPPPQPTANSTQQAPPTRPASTSSPPRSFTSPSPTPPPIRHIRSKRGLKDFINSSSSNNNSDHYHHHNLPLPVAITPSTISSPFTFSPDVVSTLPPALGHKRRHAVMLAESPGSSSGGSTPTPAQLASHGHTHSYSHPHGARRKRGRGARDGHHGQQGAYVTGNGNGNGNGGGNVSQGQPCADAMEVEEESRERKRVARR